MTDEQGLALACELENLARMLVARAERIRIAIQTKKVPETVDVVRHVSFNLPEQRTRIEVKRKVPGYEW